MGASQAELRLLGPFEVLINGRQLPVGQPKQRALLALLALRSGTQVPMSEIIDVLWDGAPPARARNQVQVYVSGLRRTFAEAGSGYRLIDTRPGGYLLDVPANWVDLAAFGRAAVDAAGQARAGDWRGADRLLHAALSCWRGYPLGGVPGEFFEQTAHQLEERRVAALEQQLRVKLALGDHTELVAGLRGTVAQYPLHEGLRHGLMLALYHSGRSAEALAIYRDGRDKIVDQLGIEPGPELRALELMILRGEPASVVSAMVRDRSATKLLDR
ncbi:BTAD domain-containing putative transcriptional regulator [Micromonospora sp. NPDC050397]|uniref:AfsR/SARP family transcriptional regulator n=1 Tax=Micromonospora sp. NPDC050397 TaxID=3364279 RepID=UPI00384C181B